jgi:hypothetical protein
MVVVATIMQGSILRWTRPAEAAQVSSTVLGMNLCLGAVVEDQMITLQDRSPNTIGIRVVIGRLDDQNKNFELLFL